MNNILDCGHPPSKHGSYTTGYGITPDGGKHCWDCCAKYDRQRMIDTGKIILYLTRKGNIDIATNWPGTLSFNVSVPSVGRHNLAHVRYDVWFRGPDNKQWHGVQYGYNTQILHCKRRST